MSRATFGGGRAAILLVLLSAALAAARPEPAFSAHVVAIADGDTITVLHERKQVRVRLHGIDCAEDGQAFGAAAKRFTCDLVFGKEVTVHPRDTDRYGRMVADVTVEGGTWDWLSWRPAKHQDGVRPQRRKAPQCSRSAKTGSRFSWQHAR